MTESKVNMLDLLVKLLKMLEIDLFDAKIGVLIGKIGSLTGNVIELLVNYM